MYVYGLSCSVVSDSLWLHRLSDSAAPLSMMFPRQECWSGVSFPTPGDLPNPGMKHVSFTSHLHWQEDSLPLAPPGKTHLVRNC